MDRYDVAIIGGGPAGSATALYLRRAGFSVCLFEKKLFPRETLCGEFLSGEVIECLKDLGLFSHFLALTPNPLDSVHVHSDRGETIGAGLGFTAYGMKRGTFDHFLLTQARMQGTVVIQPGDVQAIERSTGGFTVSYHDGTETRKLFTVHGVAAYGKQNILDKRLGRAFTNTQSHLNGIKFHIDRQHCPGIDAGAIHLFAGSHLYCGVNAVDEGKVTVCFLEHRTAGDESPRQRLKSLAAENTSFREAFTDSFEQYCETVPLHGTGNIFFGSKEAVVNGIFMVGDAAGVIAPLTGDGMGMAFEGARLLAEVFEAERAGSLDAKAAEGLYTRSRNDIFRRRLRIARTLQTILLSSTLRGFGIDLVRRAPGLLTTFAGLTRGKF
jgi:menaquinone-9 beta-reductase